MNINQLYMNIKGKIDIKKLLIFTLIAILFFGILINFEYATDTYSVFTVGARENTMHFLESGRFVTAIATVIARLLNLGENQIYFISYLLSIISLIASLYILEKIINKYVKSDKISIVISVLIILNTFIIELFLFIEKGILIFSVLMNVLAIKYAIKFLETKKWKELIKVFSYMFIANGSYQGTVGLFVTLMLVYIIKYSKDFKEFIKNNIIILFCYAMPAGIDFIIAKIFAGSRVSGNIVLFESIKKIINGIKNMIHSYGIMPKYIFMEFLMLIIVYILYKILINRDSLKTKILNMCSILYIIFGTLVITVLPQIMQNTNSIWMVARSTYAFASLPGILLLHLFVNINEEQIIKMDKIIVLVSLLFIVAQYYNFTKIEIDHYKLNAIDKEISLSIEEKIKKYEKESGNTISKISIYKDKNLTYSYKGLFVSGDINVRAYSSDWATKAIVVYYTKRNLQVIENDLNIKESFKEKDWNYFDCEQLIFNGDTLHICCY